MPKNKSAKDEIKGSTTKSKINMDNKITLSLIRVILDVM